MFPVANTQIFDILSLLTDPGAAYQARWNGLDGHERREAMEIAAQGARYRAVGAVLIGQCLFGNRNAQVSEAILRDLKTLDKVTGPETLVLCPYSVEPGGGDWRDRRYFTAYHALRGSLGGLGRTEGTADMDDRSFRSALGLKDSTEAGIIAAPHFASSAFVWIPIDPACVTDAFRKVHMLGIDGLSAFGDLVRVVPLGASIGEALRGVLAQGMKREVIASANRYPEEPSAKEELLKAAQRALDRAADEIEQILLRIQAGQQPEIADQLWDVLEYLGALRVLNLGYGGWPRGSRLLACQDSVDRAGLHPLARASLEDAEDLAEIHNQHAMPWSGSERSAKLVDDHALAVVGLARCVEVEINHSLLQWRRLVRRIQMPDYFMRYAAANGCTIEQHPEKPDRTFDINRPRRQDGDELLAPSVSQLMSIGGVLCDPSPKVGAPACDGANWRTIRQACSRLVELRNRAAHDQPVDRAAWNQALEIMRELDALGAWRAFRELREGLRSDRNGRTSVDC
jgi:hypothetical protein